MQQRVKDPYFAIIVIFMHEGPPVHFLPSFRSLVCQFFKKLYILSLAIGSKVHLNSLKSLVLSLTEKSAHNSALLPKVRRQASIKPCRVPSFRKSTLRLLCPRTVLLHDSLGNSVKMCFFQFFLGQILVRCCGDGCNFTREKH